MPTSATSFIRDTDRFSGVISYNYSRYTKLGTHTVLCILMSASIRKLFCYVLIIWCE